MADTKTQPLLRTQLKSLFGDRPDIIKAFELLFSDVSDTLPGNDSDNKTLIEAAQAAADAAAIAAAAAQLTANAALSDTTDQGAATVLTLAIESAFANSRRLAVDPKALTLTDAGAGSTLTLASSDGIAILPGDVAESAAAFANATGLLVPVVAGATYLIEALLTFTAAATTTGLALTLTLPAGALLSGMYAHNTAPAALGGSYNNASGVVGANTGDSATAAGNMAIMARWVVKVDVTAGNAQLQFRSEVAASAITLKANLSVLIARRIA